MNSGERDMLMASRPVLVKGSLLNAKSDPTIICIKRKAKSFYLNGTVSSGCLI